MSHQKNCHGKTIAVIGCGFNHIYPEEHQELFNSILEENGCIISEYEEDKEVDMKSFPQRNRIISGIAKGILVIEARNRSGSTITGRLGLEQNKPVFCLPRDIENKMGAGTNELIKRGAKLVTTPEDILEMFGIIHEKKIKITGYKKEEVNLSNIPEECIKLYKLITYTPQSIQNLSRKSGLQVPEVMQKLMMLELQGYIKNIPGNYYIRT